ncbi:MULTISPECIES: hypothetical protein [unclassified Microcoleus]
MGHHCRAPNSIAVIVASTAILPALASPIANPSQIPSPQAIASLIDSTK